MSDPKNETACCFTGHRPEKMPALRDEQHPDVVKLKMVLQADMMAKASAGCRTFISGCGKGVDIICGELVLALKERKLVDARLVCVLPFRGFEKRLGEPWTQRCEMLMRAADEVIVLGENYARGCFHRRNRYMVDHAEHVIAVYDGSETGGTAYTVQYAARQGRSIAVYNLRGHDVWKSKVCNFPQKSV